jgi:hypothetical protein
MSLESPVQRDGDMGFIGYSSRMNPVTLPAGMLQLSENMRLDRGVAVTRRGLKRLADDISPGEVPLTVPFVLTDPGPIVRNSYDGGIFAASVMRSPDEANSMEVTLLAAADRAYVYLTDGSLQFSAAWASGVLAVDGTDNLDLGAGEELVIARLPSSITYPSGESVQPSDNVSMVQAFDRMYLFREADTSQTGYEQKYTTASGISVGGGTTVATVYVTDHGYPAGARVRIEGSTSAAFDGHEFQVEAASLNANDFTIAVPTGTPSDASANIKVRRVKAPLYWTGDPATSFVRSTAGVPDVGVTFRRLRSAPWGSYIGNRLVIPDGKQNVMLSDVLDPDVFDNFWQSFRVGVGGNDKIVAVHPWVDNAVLVFCRKSIWIATISQTSAVDGSDVAINTAVTRLDLLTDEIGCAARRTICTAGQFIYFLSDSGVYRLDTKLDLKLRGETKPLSDPIADQLQGLRADLVEYATALYFDNRYFLAVPLATAVDSNNGVFIYNQLNEAWETRDIYGVGVNDFLVADINDRRRVMISSQAGKLMLMDEVEAGDESADAEANRTIAVPGKIRTRRYGMGTMSSKRFTRALADAVLPNTGSITVTANLRNPDKTELLVPGLENTTGSGNDFSLKLPIRRKAHYCELEILTNANRPEIRNISIEAAIPSLPQTETRHAA